MSLPDVHDDVDRVGEELQGELGLQQGVDLLHVVRDVLTDVLRTQTGITNLSSLCEGYNICTVGKLKKKKSRTDPTFERDSGPRGTSSRFGPVSES